MDEQNSSFIKSPVKVKNTTRLILCILLPLMAGGIAGIATSSGITGWFKTLQKPFFNPPDFLFGPVWTILYILMGVSFYLILQAQKTPQQKFAVAVFCIQLFLNFCWSFIFFKFELIGVAFIEIIVLWIGIVTMIYFFFKISKAAAFLQIPYLLWVTFASVLNGSIWMLNERIA